MGRGKREGKRTYLDIPNRLHPSRGVVFSLSKRWKNGSGDSVPLLSSGPSDIDSTALSTDHSPSGFGVGATPRSVFR